MLSSIRSGLRFASVPLVLFAAFAACSTSTKATATDASTSPDVGPSMHDAGRDTGRGAHDAGHDAGARHVDAGPGCGLCDAAKDGGHDAGGGPTPDASKGPIHSTGVSIAVTTATGTVMRTYDITVPATCDASHPFPLVFVFHGDGGNGQDMYTGFPIEAAAAAAGAQGIFVYPNGTNDNIDDTGAARAWDIYHDPGSFPYPVHDPVPAVSDKPSGNVDVDFFDAMVTTFEQKYCVDPSKIFITGMSSGGYLSNQFARWRSTVVKGTAPQSGGAPFGNNDGTAGDVGDWAPPHYCVASTSAVPALIIHGTSDGTVDPCNAIEAQSYWDMTNACPDASSDCTATVDSCTGSNLAAPSAAPTTTSPLNSLCQQTTGCGSPVVLCEVPGMGHSIWSLAPTVIWSFFASL